MIVKDPYRSKALSLYKIASIPPAVNRYITIDYVHVRENEPIRFKPFENQAGRYNPVILYGATDSEKDIPPFNHPLANDDHRWIALDLRNYVKFGDNRETYEIRNEGEFRLCLLRYALSALWYIGKRTSLYSLKLPHFAFSSWLSDNLTSKFGLDMADAVRLKVLALVYYTRMFSEQPESDELDLLLIRCKGEAMLPDVIKDVYAQIGELNNIDDFCEACYAVTGNVRLKGFNYLLLVNILSGNWFGTNGPELIKLALEHPPTWIAMTYAALTHRTFKKNHVTTLVERLAKRGRGEEFVKLLDAISADTMVGGPHA